MKPAVAPGTQSVSAHLWREQVMPTWKLPIKRQNRTSIRNRAGEGSATVPSRGAPPPAERGGPGGPTLAGEDGEQAVDHDHELLGLGVAPRAA